MAENIFIKKRQKQRRRENFLTIKLILRLVVASVLMLLGFLYFVGDPTTSMCENGCESEFSLATWIFGFFILFAGVAVLGGLVGGLVAFLRWKRRDSIGTLTAMMEDSNTHKDPKH